jgi:Ca2+-binding RTX toxin-like protein
LVPLLYVCPVAGNSAWTAKDTMMATVKGTNGGDTLYGTSAADTIQGLGGNDTLKGFGGADGLDGGTGIDAAFYSDSAVGVAVNLATGRGIGGSAQGDTLVNIENLFGSNHNDTLTGDDGNNELHGLSGNDILVSADGDDRLAGGDGNDILKGGGGSDHLDGGAGIDTADYSAALAHVSADLGNGGIAGGEAFFDRFVDVENLTGSPFGGTLFGNDGANVLRGLDGNDGLFGFAGNDTLIGGSGIDGLDGGVGADTMRGGAGNDNYTVDNVGDVVIESAGEGIDGVATTISYTLGPNVENLFLFPTFPGGIDGTGNELDNFISGNARDNVIDGGGGADRMLGDAGNDTFFVDNAGDSIGEFGGDGIDIVRTSVSFTLTPGADVELLGTQSNSGTAAINLTGNASGNVVFGNDGNNVINGGDGRDELSGLGGEDFFTFDTPLNAATNLDTIDDFNVADDTILLADAIFSSLSAALGNLPAGQFVIATAAQDADDHVIYNNATGALFYDSDGNGAASQIQFATLSTGLALTHLDFFVTG